MLTFFAILLGTIVAVFLIILVIFLRIRNSIKRTVGDSNFKLLKDRLSEGIKNGELNEGSFAAEMKSISGMTEILEPKIRRDFDDFHASELFNLCNKNLKTIFNCLEEKSITYLDNDPVFDLIKANIYEQIQDMIGRNIEVAYDVVKINRNALASYTNKDGSATIEVNTSLSYYYKTNNKKEKNYEKYRKETRFKSKYILVYNAEAFDGKSITYAVNCPNCGAPVPTKGDTTCKYCNSHVDGVNFDTINLKSWKLVDFTEY